MDEACFLLVCEGLFEPWDKASAEARQAAFEAAKPIQYDSGTTQGPAQQQARGKSPKQPNKKARHSKSKHFAKKQCGQGF
jgi:hypothetical protein